jgi:hypothetical protein
MIRRRVCSFVTEINLAQNNGAIEVVIVNSVPGGGAVNGGGVITQDIIIPTVGMSFEDVEALIAAIENKTIIGVLRDDGAQTDLVQRDGDLDQRIIAHAHGIFMRQVGGRLNFA